MGLIRAFSGAIGGSLADQWRDFLTVPPALQPTAALFPAVRMGRNAGRGSNVLSSDAVVTNGSKIIVPEGYGLLLLEDGELTAFVSEPGGYVWNSENVESESIFSGGSLYRSIILQSWDRFKFGGRPSAQQTALFVSLKELPNNKFGTQSDIYWDDSYLNAQVGATTRGTYSLSIVDPIVFAKGFVPATYLQGQQIFDFTDLDNAAASQVFSEVVSSLASAFSIYTNDASQGNRITNIQRDSVGFAHSLSSAVERSYQWQGTRGITISKVAILGIEYDAQTRELLTTVQRADALTGSRGNANLQASFASGFAAAGENDGSAGILGLGIAANSAGLAGLMQPTNSPSPNAGADLVSTIENLKRAYDAGLIDEGEFRAAKAKALGL